MKVKNFVLLFLVMFVGFVATAQEIEGNSPNPIIKPDTVKLSKESEIKIYDRVDIKPKALFDINEFVTKNVVYPSAAKAINLTGTVLIYFVVERDGSISSVKYFNKPLGYGLEEEAVRLVKQFPKFSPAFYNGKAVRSSLRIPIIFKL